MRLFLISSSFILSLLIFQSGFLLRRRELHMKSSCSDAKLDHSECWMPQQHRKIVLIIIDALRYDFLLPVGNYTSHYLGKMPTVSALLSRGAAIGTVLADPPTTTLQRIKALTTGTLPTFIDASDNFAASANVQEDNLLWQARNRKRNVSFMGDNTWTSLYPDVFAYSKPFESFDINDLNTVDDTIRVLLRDEMRRPEHVDLVIAHLLGVDHCGHKYGPDHPQMAHILRKMDLIISETSDALSEGDLLVVLGDHGMTSSGDHGGDSNDEINAGILVYSPSRPMSLPTTPIQQIDIVPTLSLLLGLPIPFSNLGTVIDSLLPAHLRNEAIALNFEQIRRFANTYAAANPFFDLSVITSHDAVTIEEQINVMARIQSTLRSTWTQFDVVLMRVGLVTFTESLLFVCSSRSLDAPLSIIRSGCLLLQFSIVLGGADQNPAVPLLMIVLPLSMLYSLASLLSHIIPLRIGYSLAPIFAYICVAFHSMSLLSNSFIIYEGQITRFLIQSILVFSFWTKLNKFRWDRKFSSNFSRLMPGEFVLLLISLLFLRLEPQFHRCREEEKGCTIFYFVEQFSILSPDAQFWRFMFGISSALFLNTVICRNLLPANGALRIGRALSWPVHGALALYHIIQLAPIAVVKNVQRLGIGLSLFIYMCSITVGIICIFNPLPFRRASFFCLVQAVSWPFLLLLGDGLQPALVILAFIIYISFQICDQAVLPPLFSLLVPFGFYLTGHSPTLPAIPWQAAFVGLPGNFPLRFFPALLIISHLCVSSVLVPLTLPFHPNTTASSMYALLGISAFRSLSSCIAAMIHKRHLMVWKIFAPRFIFESILFIYLLFVINITILVCRKMKIF